MIPRGEVGLIFATFGLAHAFIGEGMYSILVVVIMLTTLVTPPILKKLMENK